MSLGLPNFNFIFQSKGVSAIERSARGIVAVILKDDTEGEEQNVYNKVDDVDFTQWTEDNYNYLKLIYEGAPSKVIAMRVATNVESYNAVLKKLKDLKWNYLCIPGIKAADTTMIGAWIKQYRNDEKKTFKVVLPHYAGDHEGIINFTTENITSSVTGKKHTAAEYCARIAGILAGLSLSRSSTFYVLNDVSSAEVPDDPNERIDAGELILTFDGSQYKIGRGVNSLTSFTATKTEDFRKIKIVEGMDLYMDDIRDTFEKYYVGKVINDYDNKQMFVAASDTLCHCHSLLTCLLSFSDLPWHPQISRCWSQRPCFPYLLRPPPYHPFLMCQCPVLPGNSSGHLHLQIRYCHNCDPGHPQEAPYGKS